MATYRIAIVLEVTEDENAPDEVVQQAAEKYLKELMEDGSLSMEIKPL